MKVVYGQFMRVYIVYENSLNNLHNTMPVGLTFFMPGQA